jgi:hypothetical protein
MFDAQHQADFADRSKIMPTRAITEPKPIGHKNNMPGRDKSPLKAKSHNASPKAPPITAISCPTRWIRLATATVAIEVYFHMEKLLVELTGIEPVASWLQTRRSPSWATAPQPSN